MSLGVSFSRCASRCFDNVPIARQQAACCDRGSHDSVANTTPSSQLSHSCADPFGADHDDGRIDGCVGNAPDFSLAHAAVVPGAPTGVTPMVSSGQMGVVWAPPASSGDSAITSYTATASPGGANCVTSATFCIIPGLTNGQMYTFSVVATNATGPSSPSVPSIAVAPGVAPTPPTNVTAVAGGGSATVSWTPPLGFGFISSFQATSAPFGKTCTASMNFLALTPAEIIEATSSNARVSCLMTGLESGTAYTFTVTASPIPGLTSLPSVPSGQVTPTGPPSSPPDAPVSVVAVAGNASATVSWGPPPTLGGLVNKYVATATPGGATCATTGALSCVISGLANGTAYTFRVVASTPIGSGSSSLASAAVTPSASIAAPLLSPLPPARLLETRAGLDTVDGVGEGGGRALPGSVTEVLVAGRGGVAAGAGAVSLNVTAVFPDGPGFVTVFPCGQEPPLASNINFLGSGVFPNAVISKVGAGGKVCLFTTTATDLLVDVNGSFADGAGLSPLPPARLLETRAGLDTVDGVGEGGGRALPGSVTEVLVAGRGGVAAGAGAVSLNVTAVFPDGPGFVTVFPCGQEPPLASNINFLGSGVFPNAVISKVGAGGKVCLFTTTATDLLVDVNGSFADGAGLSPLPPARLLETRAGLDTVDGVGEGGGRALPGSVTEVLVAGRGGVAAGAGAVSLNVTAVFPDGPGFVTVFPWSGAAVGVEYQFSWFGCVSECGDFEGWYGWQGVFVHDDCDGFVGRCERFLRGRVAVLSSPRTGRCGDPRVP